MNHPSLIHTPALQPLCGRRSFLRSSAAMAALAGLSKPASLLSEVAAPSAAVPASSESVVKLLFESLLPAQRKEMCFPWDYVDPKRGLLRTRIENNWRITKPIVKSDFYTRDQQAM